MDHDSRFRFRIATWAHWVGNHPVGVAACLYFLSSLVIVPLDPRLASRGSHWQIGHTYLFVGRPIVLSGDPPHYLVVLNSLIEDGDLEVSNNYRQAEQGDWDMGTAYRGRAIDHHAERDLKGRERSNHSPFLPLVLALIWWPLAGSEWVESACIWTTLAAVLGSVWLWTRRYPEKRVWALALTLATPLWCYSRDIWPEPWLAAIWLSLLVCRNAAVLVALAAAGILIKYTFAVVPAALGVLAFWESKYQRAALFWSATVVGVLIAVATAQYLFRDADHFNLFHLAKHNYGPGIAPVAGLFKLQLRGAAGLLLDPENGLLWFFPFLAWGFWEFRKGGRWYVPAIAFFLLHALYSGWKGGTGFSARYLVPALPALIWAVSERQSESRLFKTALGVGIFWGAVAGFFPALVYDSTPWKILVRLLT